MSRRSRASFRVLNPARRRFCRVRVRGGSRGLDWAVFGRGRRVGPVHRPRGGVACLGCRSHRPRRCLCLRGHGSLQGKLFLSPLERRHAFAVRLWSLRLRCATTVQRGHHPRPRSSPVLPGDRGAGVDGVLRHRPGCRGAGGSRGGIVVPAHEERPFCQLFVGQPPAGKDAVCDFFFYLLLGRGVITA